MKIEVLKVFLHISCFLVGALSYYVLKEIRK